MKKYILIAVVIIALVVGYKLFNNKPVEDQIIKIGLIAPLSGPYAVIGEGLRDAALLAAKDNPNIQIISEDDGADAKKGVSAYHKLTEIDKVDVVFNLLSPTLEAIQPLINERKIITFQLGESGTHVNDTVFQIMPFSYPLFTTLAKEADKKYDRVAVVYGNADIFMLNADYFKQGIGKDQIVYETKVGADNDMRSEVTKLLATNPDATTVLLDVETGTKFLKALRDQMGNKKVAIICDANMEISIGDYVKALGNDDLLEGCLSTNLPGISSDQFKADFKAAYGYDAPPISDYGYDAMNVIKQLANKPKDSWLGIIQNMKFAGISGEVSFDETGTRFPQAEIHIYQDGKFVKLP